jgi:hypothetical protein
MKRKVLLAGLASCATLGSLFFEIGNVSSQSFSTSGTPQTGAARDPACGAAITAAGRRSPR